MKPQVNTTDSVETTPVDAPEQLSLDVLRHVAGGLPYGGWHQPPTESLTQPDGDLPYGGWQ